MESYLSLNQNNFKKGDYTILPIRHNDRYDIMKWRNEQKYHLRQKKILTKQSQDIYFNEVLKQEFEKKFPNQIIFSYLDKGKCIGYGGLVHINWKKRNSEISFIMDTKLEISLFDFHWSNFLNLIEKVAFDELDLNRIYTHAYNVRPRLYNVLLKNNYNQESKIISDNLKKSNFSLIHSKISKKIILIEASIEHVNIAFKWATCPSIRKFSFSKSEIDFNSHKNWFSAKINNPDCFYYFLKIKNNICGSIRFDRLENNFKISYLIDKEFQGNGFGKIILFLGILFLSKNFKSKIEVFGDVKNNNFGSIKIFEYFNFNKEELSKNIFRFKKILNENR